MLSRPTILLILSFPAGAIAYSLAAQFMASLDVPEPAGSFLVLFAPLFVAGLVMLPFLIPFFDRKAKEDLAAHRSQTETSGESDPPDPKES